MANLLFPSGSIWLKDNQAVLNGQIRPTYNGKEGQEQFPKFMGASLRTGTSDGVLVVHPKLNKDGDNYPLDLVSGGGMGAIEFDYIIEDGTTVNLDYVDVFIRPAV